MIPLYPKSWQRAAVLATIGAILAVGLCAWPYTVDDAFIVARYAMRLARGQGYTFNPGPATDGVTGPLWLLPGWLASIVHGDPVRAAKVAGLVCTMLACAAVVHRLSRRAGGTRYAWAAALLLACEPTLGGWAIAGLETGAATLALTLAALSLTARPRPHVLRLGGTLAFVPWLRPELLGAAGALLLGAVFRLGWRWSAPALVLSGLGVATVLVFRAAMFGDVLPLAYHAKQGSLEHGVDYALRGVPIVAGVFGLALIGRGVRVGRWEERLFGWVLLAHVAAIVLAGGDWMPGFRLFAPVAPLAFSVMAVGALRPFARGRARARFAWFGLAALTIAVLVLDLSTRIPEWRAAGASREGAGRALAERLRRSATRVALVDVGFLAYASGVDVIDLGGITDPEVARLPGGHLDKAVTDAWLSRRAPDALLLHSARPPLVAANGKLQGLDGYPVERRLASGAWVQKRFRVVEHRAYAPGYHYVLLLPHRGD